jgi:hypothetical protein
MGIARFLVKLYPKKWRALYGEEFAALIEDTRGNPGVIWDIVINGMRLRVKAHGHLALLLLASFAWSTGLEYISVHESLTANILWPPTNLERGLALLGTTGPWLAFAGAALRRRLGGGHSGVGHSPTPHERRGEWDPRSQAR